MTSKLRKIRKSFFKRFFEKVNKTPACWFWTANMNWGGYGQINRGRIRDGKVLAHRASWELHTGKSVPKGKFVLHHCDIRHCVNPKHLYVGTKLDNMRDARIRGRICRGEQRPNAKLNYKKVFKIKKLLAENKIRKCDIAILFGVSAETINGIVHNKTWTHVVFP